MLDRIRFDIHRLPRGGPWIHAQNGVTRDGGVTTFASLHQRVDVSIRARSRRSGRPVEFAIEIGMRKFQSAPAPVGAGDAFVDNTQGTGPLFQSAPAPVGAGDLDGWAYQRADAVSIRARSRRSGRRSITQLDDGTYRFQSAPAPVGAGDLGSLTLKGALLYVSIRARSRRSGRRGRITSASPARSTFQSAPAPVGAGDWYSPRH